MRAQDAAPINAPMNLISAGRASQSIGVLSIAQDCSTQTDEPFRFRSLSSGKCLLFQAIAIRLYSCSCFCKSLLTMYRHCPVSRTHLPNSTALLTQTNHYHSVRLPTPGSSSAESVGTHTLGVPRWNAPVCSMESIFLVRHLLAKFCSPKSVHQKQLFKHTLCTHKVTIHWPFSR